MFNSAALQGGFAIIDNLEYYGEFCEDGRSFDQFARSVCKLMLILHEFIPTCPGAFPKCIAPGFPATNASAAATSATGGPHRISTKFRPGINGCGWRSLRGIPLFTGMDALREWAGQAAKWAGNPGAAAELYRLSNGTSNRDGCTSAAGATPAASDGDRTGPTIANSSNFASTATAAAAAELPALNQHCSTTEGANADRRARTGAGSGGGK